MTTAARRTEFTRRARKGTGLRVKIVFPLIVMLAVAVTGFGVYAVTRSALGDTIPEGFEHRILTRVYPLIFAMSTFGLVIGLALSYYVIAPLRQLAIRIESAPPLAGTSEIKRELVEQSTGAGVVFGELGVALEEMIGSLDSYRLEGYILDSLASAMITINQEGIVTSFNQPAERILGASAAEVLGAHFDLAFSDHPVNVNFRRVLLDGIERGVSVSSLEITLLNQSGKEVLVGVSISPLRDENGEHLGIVLTFKDLAAVKQAQAQLERADQLATLGSFAAGMAHEIRNPLASLHGMVELLIEDVPEEDPKRPFLDTIQRNLTRLTGLTENLLSLAHPGEIQFEPTDINMILKDAAQLARYENREETLEIEERYQWDLAAIYADSEKLSRAFLNVIMNAFQATPASGKITIETDKVDLGSPLTGGVPSVFAAVTNTGSYISPEDRQKLFTPFYTTKARGVGLGLAITHQIVSAHSGQLTVESDPKWGTCFRIYLPVEAPQKEKA